MKAVTTALPDYRIDRIMIAAACQPCGMPGRALHRVKTISPDRQIAAER